MTSFPSQAPRKPATETVSASTATASGVILHLAGVFLVLGSAVLLAFGVPQIVAHEAPTAVTIPAMLALLSFSLALVVGGVALARGGDDLAKRGSARGSDPRPTS